MIFFMHHAVTGWAVAPLLAGHLGAGVVAGMLYFRALRRATDDFAAGSGAARALRMGAGRLAGLAGVLLLAAQEGAGPLLCLAAGVMLARFAITRAAMMRLPPANAG